MIGVEEEVLGFEITVNDAELVEVFNPGDELLEEFCSFVLLDLALLDYVVEKFTTACIFKDKI